ncbi:hypothetical protein ACOMHN_034704 [Nucella lapillus]
MLYQNDAENTAVVKTKYTYIKLDNNTLLKDGSSNTCLVLVDPLAPVFPKRRQQRVSGDRTLLPYGGNQEACSQSR